MPSEKSTRKKDKIMFGKNRSARLKAFKIISKLGKRKWILWIDKPHALPRYTTATLFSLCLCHVKKQTKKQKKEKDNKEKQKGDGKRRGDGTTHITLSLLKGEGRANEKREKDTTPKTWNREKRRENKRREKAPRKLPWRKSSHKRWRKLL